jgi:hypothetical protein
MKKIYFLAAIALVAGVSCTKQVPVAQIGQESPLTFSAVTAPNTKTVYGEIPAAYDTGESFVAYAGWTADVWTAGTPTEFFNGGTSGKGEICSYNSEWYAWSPANTYYWPKTGYLVFEAYSPSAAASCATHTWADGFSFTNFTVPATIAAQYDLMYSNREFNKRRSDYGTTDTSHNNAYDNEDDSGNYKYNGVDLMFNHILSSIRFLVKTKANYSTNATITLTGLTINNAYSVGDFAEGVSTAAPAASFAKTPAWSGQESEATYTVVSTGTQEVIYNGGTAQPLTGDPDIILLPQSLEHTGVGAHDVTVTVNYTISQHDSADIAQTSTITLKNLTSSSATIDEWELGKRYTYTIVFGLDEIYFDPAVSAWTDVVMDPYEI